MSAPDRNGLPLLRHVCEGLAVYVVLSILEVWGREAQL
jgi:hypothetical protein